MRRLLTQALEKRQDALARESKIEGGKAAVLNEKHHCQEDKSNEKDRFGKAWRPQSLLMMFILMLCGSHSFCTESSEQNPGVYLNLQDLPIFSEDNNPLTGMQAFNLIPPISLKDSKVQKEVQKAIEKELEKVGEVIHLKDEDMRGFGSGNILLIQVGSVLGWDGTRMPISRISLQVETSAVINKTGVKTFPAVWSMNTFFQGAVDPDSEGRLLEAVQKFVGEFVQNYKYANREQKKKPIFYTYY